MKKFNHDMRPDRFFGKRWENFCPNRLTAARPPMKCLTKNSPLEINSPTLSPAAKKLRGRVFIHNSSTPFANDYLIDFAKAAIESEQLGADDVTDLLTVSFSSNDLVGHSYGPYSQEVQDMTLRTDRTLAELFNYLDRKIGLDRVVIALTADHGVAPVPARPAVGLRRNHRAEVGERCRSERAQQKLRR